MTSAVTSTLLSRRQRQEGAEWELHDGSPGAGECLSLGL